MKSIPILLLAASLLTGCASTPLPLTAQHPASPDAPEGARIARRTSLRPDEATRKSHALLSAAEKEQEAGDENGLVSGTPEDAPKTSTKSEVKHDHH